MSTANAVFATLWDLPQLPSVFWCAFSHQRTFITHASVFASPYPAPPRVAAPIEPGVREPVMDLIVTGDLTIATESIGAGLTETCAEGGEGTGVTVETGPGFGVSTMISTSSIGGGSMSSGGISSSSFSSSGSSSMGAMSTTIVSFFWPEIIVTTQSTTPKSSGTTIATSGAARRCSSMRAILYSRESRGCLRPLNMSPRRLKKPRSSYFFAISSRSIPSPTTDSTSSSMYSSFIV